MAAKIITNFIAKQIFKQKGAIANNKAVKFSADALESRLKNLGIDPNAITSEKELNQILNLVKQAENQAFNQRFGDMLGGSKFDRKGEVFDMQGKKINPSKGIMGGKEINEQTLKEGLMKTDNPFSDLVKTTDQGPKTLKQREAEVLANMEKNNKETVQRIKNRKMIKDAVDNASPGFVSGDRKYNAQLVADDLAEKRFGKDFYDLDQKQQTDLYGEALDGLDDSDKFAQGGRAGFKSGLGFFASLFGKGGKMFRKRGDVPTSVFSQKKGPITIEDMANISKDDLRKIRRTQELGLYDETPEILKAGNLFDRFTKKVGGKRVIDYDRAEFILNRKLKGDETLNELLQIEYQTRPGRADGGRIGLKAGMTKRAFLKLMGSVGAGIAGLKSGLLGIGKGTGKQVAEEVVKKSTSTPPPYFFELAETIKKFGRVSDGPAERIKIHSMPAKDGKSELMLTEDIGTGEMQIKKIGKENDEMISEVQTMDYSPSSALSDESGKVPGQYDEYTEVQSRIYKDEFNEPDIIDGIKVDEIIKEVREAPSIKKAGGGIARMLGE